MSRLTRLFCKAALITTITAAAITDGVLWVSAARATNGKQERDCAIAFSLVAVVGVGAALGLAALPEEAAKNKPPSLV